MGLTRLVVRSKFAAFLSVALLTAGAGGATYYFQPKLDYLPNGNRNLVFGFVLPPPGYNLPTMVDIAGKLEDATRDLWDPEGERLQDENGRPTIQRFFFAAFRANAIVAAAAVDPSRAKDLGPVLRSALFSEPGTFGFFRQRSLFGRGVGGSNSIDLDISGGDLNEIVSVAQSAFGMVNQAFPRGSGTQIRPRPSLSLGAPEVRVVPDRVKLADNGVSTLELGQTIDTFNDGLRIAEITVDGERLDLTLKGPLKKITETQGINDLPVVTSSGMILPANSLARIEVTAGPTEIRHKSRERTITLVISPPDTLPLEASMDILRTKVIRPLEASGLPPAVKIRMSGTADKLTQTWDEMLLNLIMALVIVYLVMAILFESFFYPLIIIFSVPLATAGGILGLGLLNLHQQQNLDMLTLLGFVILIGIVVNNAILLVHQTLHHLRSEGMSVGDAIIEATGNRIRPIFMSTLTSVLGMLPLVLFPGAGSELYRGLGSVVIGGLTLSAVLTLAVVPPLLSLFMGAIESRAANTRTSVAPEPIKENVPEKPASEPAE